MSGENFPMFTPSPDRGILGAAISNSVPIMSTGYAFQTNPVQNPHPMIQPMMHMPPPRYQVPEQSERHNVGAKRPNSWPNSAYRQSYIQEGQSGLAHPGAHPGYFPQPTQPCPSVATIQQQPDHQYQNLEDMIEKMELRIMQRMQVMIDKKLAEKQENPWKVTNPIFTDLSSFEDISPNDPRAYKGDLDSRCYRIIDFKGGIGMKTAANCKTFLQDIVQTGKDFDLTYEKTIALLKRHTREEARDLVSNEIRNPYATLESIIRSLEMRYMSLVPKDTALKQLHEISRRDGEDLYSLYSRLSDRAQMATRGESNKINKEKELVKARFLSCLPNYDRNILREREKMRLMTGQNEFTLRELVDAAQVLEEESKSSTMQPEAETQQIVSSTSSSSLYHRRSGPKRGR